MRARTKRLRLSERTRRSASDYVAAEKRHFKLGRKARFNPEATDTDRHRARKARSRAIASGDRLADNLCALAELGLHLDSSAILVRVRHEINVARRHLTGGPRTGDEVPVAHPLADPNRPYAPLKDQRSMSA